MTHTHSTIAPLNMFAGMRIEPPWYENVKRKTGSNVGPKPTGPLAVPEPLRSSWQERRTQCALLCLHSGAHSISTATVYSQIPPPAREECWKLNHRERIFKWNRESGKLHLYEGNFSFKSIPMYLNICSKLLCVDFFLNRIVGYVT